MNFIVNDKLKVTQRRGTMSTKRKIDKNLFKCLSHDNGVDKEILVNVLAYMMGKLGEQETFKVLRDMDRKGVKLIDVLKVLQGGIPGDNLKAPEIELNPIDRVRNHLISNHGAQKGVEVLKEMGAHEIISLDDKLKKGDSEHEDGSLRMRSLIDFPEEKGEDTLQGPTLQDYKNVHETDKAADNDDDALSLPK